MSGTRHDEAPEVAHYASPEFHEPPSVPEAVVPGTPIKPEESTNPSILNAGYGTSPSPYVYHDPQLVYGPIEQERRPTTVWGCSILVFVLSAIIAILSAAVIGLAAGTGVEASRANNAEARLASMTGSPATVTVTAATSSPSDFSTVDKGCSKNSASVTGTTYASQFFDRQTFKIYCNSDAPNNPISSLFVGNFDDCMDACAFYTYYIPSDFPTNATSNNATCAGVSYIPAWTNRTTAQDGGAPGNCYLKPGPQNQTALNNPNIGGFAVHAAILST
ncbi:uncharacterized protein GGS22DRAFT_184787 [Annulohypoxylon maeteangense]|uniref:uncharacterized protein n=1 Tax=Annulohypoxylon maeteangense TaxID=1927788 RepID=UPI00200776FF|nr:uncharacterized protein GGS22DRAFT_184787 [Annulohypoxylon maeteangense]KAI0889213.1 hypothetical protein GGS22DRAFT_184787 [Annulohypoxylon maeteangense]